MATTTKARRSIPCRLSGMDTASTNTTAAVVGTRASSSTTTSMVRAHCSAKVGTSMTGSGAGTCNMVAAHSCIGRPRTAFGRTPATFMTASGRGLEPLLRVTRVRSLARGRRDLLCPAVRCRCWAPKACRSLCWACPVAERFARMRRRTIKSPTACRRRAKQGLRHPRALHWDGRRKNGPLTRWCSGYGASESRPRTSSPTLVRRARLQFPRAVLGSLLSRASRILCRASPRRTRKFGGQCSRQGTPRSAKWLGMRRCRSEVGPSFRRRCPWWRGASSRGARSWRPEVMGRSRSGVV
mmetsp:Transcript_82942/g.231348  ORF Transcript_82942/g.231348 Transcript_82942/m.231348 type:complete len:297 (-) Transcript_82942:1333-2223(-)